MRYPRRISMSSKPRRNIRFVIRRLGIWRQDPIWLSIGIPGLILGQLSRYCPRSRRNRRRYMRQRQQRMLLQWIAYRQSSRRGCNWRDCSMSAIRSTICRRSDSHNNKRHYLVVIRVWIEQILPLLISGYRIERVTIVMCIRLVRIVRVIVRILRRFRSKLWSSLNCIF